MRPEFGQRQLSRLRQASEACDQGVERGAGCVVTVADVEDAITGLWLQQGRDTDVGEIINMNSVSWPVAGAGGVSSVTVAPPASP